MTFQQKNNMEKGKVIFRIEFTEEMIQEFASCNIANRELTDVELKDIADNWGEYLEKNSAEWDCKLLDTVVSGALSLNVDSNPI